MTDTTRRGFLAAAGAALLGGCAQAGTKAEQEPEPPEYSVEVDYPARWRGQLTTHLDGGPEIDMIEGESTVQYDLPAEALGVEIRAEKVEAAQAVLTVRLYEGDEVQLRSPVAAYPGAAGIDARTLPGGGRGV